MTQPVAIIADAHLMPNNPSSWSDFERLLDILPRPATLVSLGDFFDIWYRPLRDHFKEYEGLIESIRQATGEGVEFHLLNGNRDFLLSARDAEDIGAQLHNEPWQLAVDGQHFHLIHGDILLTADLAYQRYRRMVRSGPVRWFARSCPLGLVNSVANRIRRRSSRDKSLKPVTDFELDLDLARTLLGNCDELICGHTHIERIDHLNPGILRVLPAFGESGRFLRRRPDGSGWDLSSIG